MTTQVSNHFVDHSVTLSPTANRVTPQPARPFAQVLNAGANAVLTNAEAATQRLPGGPLLAAALRPLPGEAPMVSAGAGPASGTAVWSNGIDNEPDSLQLAVQTQAENSLHYLQLQQQIQEENRNYSTLSNVLKARHETVKNAIGNIR